MLTLVARSFGRVRRIALALAAVLVGFQFSLMAAAVSLHESGDFLRLQQAVPAFIREAIGPALGSFAGMTVLAYWEPAILFALCFCAAYVASEPASDVESGLVDLILARPLPRRWVITRSLIVMTATCLAMVAVLGGSNWMALALMAPDGAVWPERRVILLMMAHLAAVMWCFGSASLAIAAYAGRRIAAMGVLSLALVTTYMLHLLQTFTDRFDGVGWFTPFHYFQGTAILDGSAPLKRNFTVLLGTGLIAIVAAYQRFSRRDL